MSCDDPKKLKEFRGENELRLAIDHAGYLVYLVSGNVNLQMTKERFPDIWLLDTREQGAAVERS